MARRRQLPVAPAARATRGVSNLVPGEPHTPRIVRVGLTQMACTEDPAANLERQLKLVEQAAAGGAEIICTQEIFRSQYFCQVEDHRFFTLAETIPGPSTDACSQVARERGVVIIASLFERRAAGLYHNTAAVIDADGSLLGVYRKMHIPDDPLYYEKF
jgi:N-carbamoylputrescine amidase